MILCLDVDDILIFGTNMELINNTKLILSSHFKMKDLGEADVILGVKIRKIENGFSFCQSHYVEKILKNFDSFVIYQVRISYDASKILRRIREIVSNLNM